MPNLQVKAFCREYFRPKVYDSLMCVSHFNGSKIYHVEVDQV